MKTTENISLAGYAFTIETDAYEMLTAYLSEIHESFSDDEYAEEIVADIEERIAELLKEKCVGGMTVNTQTIDDIRRRIGDPKDLAHNDSESVEEPTKTGTEKSKRLYRNLDEKVLGGVCSGLGEYFGIDKVLFRLAFIILSFISIFGSPIPTFIIPLLAYSGLWIAMPAARTNEQKREMKGRPVNLENYRQKDFDFGKEVKEAVESPAGRTLRRAGGIFLGLLLLLVGLSGMLSSIISPSLPVIIGHEIAEEVADWGPLDEQEQFFADLFTGSSTFWILLLVTAALAFIWFLYNGIMLIFDIKYPSWRPGLILFVAWVISIFVIAAWFIRMISTAVPILFW